MDLPQEELKMPALLRATFVLAAIGTVLWSSAASSNPFVGNQATKNRQGWRSESTMLDPANSASAGGLNGIFYVAGGMDNTTNAIATLQSYDPTTNAWTYLAPLPETRYSGNGIGAINGKLYVAGGWNGAFPTNTLYVYDLAKQEWTTRAPMPQLSGCGASGVINSQLYVISPCDGFGGVATYLDRYDPGSDTWTSLANSHVGHSQSAAAVINGKFYVAGGVTDGQGDLTDVTEVYDPAGKSWTKLAKMRTPVQNPASVELDGKLWVFGGSSAGTLYSLVQVYDPVKNKWEKSRFALPVATTAGAAAAVDGVAFFAGGGTGTETVGNTYALFVLPSIP
jgi:N-acetylneuraminic acid mutarotase